MGADFQFESSILLGSWLPLHVARNVALGKLPLHSPGESLALLAKFFAPNAWCGAAAGLWAVALAVALVPGLQQRVAFLPLALAAAAAMPASALLPAAVRWLGGARPTAAFHPHTATPPDWCWRRCRRC